MERLTIDNINRVIDARVIKENAMAFYWKLKEYEDTGLTPDQIKELAKKLNN